MSKRVHPTARHSAKLWDMAQTAMNNLGWIAPEDVDMRRTKILDQLLLATAPLAEIQALMGGKVWTPETLGQVAGVLRRAGFEIEDPR